MKKVIILFLSFFLVSQIKAQKEVIKMNGHWTKQNTSWDAIFEAEFYVNSNDSICGIINWSYLNIGIESKSYYEQSVSILNEDGKTIYLTRKEAKAAEYITGYYDRKINTLFIKGIGKTDPAGIIGIDVYKMELIKPNKFSGIALSGENNWSGILNGTFFIPSEFVSSNSEIKENFEDLEKNCVLSLPFDGNYKDVSAKQQPTHLGTGAYEMKEKYTEGIYGVSNTAFYFDYTSYGRGLYINGYNGSNEIEVFDLTKMKKFSISFLFKPDMITQYGKLFGTNGYYKDNLFSIDINESNKIEINIDNKIPITSKSDVIPNKYHHLFLSYNGKELALFYDGKLEQKVEFKIPKIELGTFSSSTQDKVQYKIGSYSWEKNKNSTYIGAIDEFKIYNTNINEQFIQSLYSTYFPSFTKDYLQKKYKVSSQFEEDILEAITLSGNRLELIRALELFYSKQIILSSKIKAGKFLLSTSKSITDIYKLSLLIPEIKVEASDLALLKVNSIENFATFIKLFPNNPKVLIENSSFFYGEVDKRNFKQGKGYYFNEKISYDGNWKDNTYTGTGYLTTQDYILNGNFQNGKLNGKGIYYNFNTKERYEGDFLNGIYNGNCIQWSFEDFTYSGEVANGKFHGNGKCEKKDGSWYQGEFKNGYENGIGTLRQTTGLRYTGKFIDGLPNGRFKIQRWTLMGLAKDEWTAEYQNGSLVNSSQTETGMTDFLNSKPTTSSSSNTNSNNSSSNQENNNSTSKEIPSVKKIEFEQTKSSFVMGESDKYYVTFTDGTSGYIFCTKKNSKWYINNGQEDFEYNSKDNALAALYEYKDKGTIRKIGRK